MKKALTLGLAASAVLVLAQAQAGEGGNNAKWEYSGYLKNETGLFQRRGTVIGERPSTTDTREHGAGEAMKFENSLVLFFNGDLVSNARLHGQVNIVSDIEAIDGYRGHQSYSQQDLLRELYVDTKAGKVDLRLGKQQLVWGTADGIKLLDIINPTDWREFTQNTMDESRIPVWMAKADVGVTPKDNLQFVVAQRQESRIPGLNQYGDKGHAFIMKGVDSITGPVNGFRNIVPEMGAISRTFFNFAAGGAFGGVPLNAINYMTVNDFATSANPMGNGVTGANMLNGLAYTYPAASGGISANTNLVDGGTTNWDANNPNSTFEYMSNATFATFDAFVNAKTAYVRDYPEETVPNLGLRYKSTLGRDFNYSLNYLWHYDPNPYIDMQWQGTSGENLTPTTSAGVDAFTGRPTTTVSLPGYGGAAGKVPTLLFTEKLNRIHSMGAAFDTSFDTASLGPVVARAEFLYQKETKTPVIDRTKLGYGDLVGGMRMEEADQFKYVLGADFSFLTNLMVNVQFIQFINLDYVDEAGSNGANSGRYTADQATLHLSNNLRKGAHYREFGSLFLSKPFGAEQQGRVNNITIAEESGGYWNRFDVEYGFTDALVGSFEVNNYFGNTNTMFGQFKESSNVQVGMKVLF
ncbi:MAG: RNA polymerase-associated protein rapA [Magnetococcales bacterium]|nr:RNA polymerase-associated protein rapA [Magnetococcales bacterium]